MTDVRTDLAARPTPSARRQDVTTAVGTFAIGLLFLAVGISRTWGDAPGDLALFWRVVLLAVACALLLVKRRAPISVLVASLAVFGVDLWHGQQIGILFTLIDALYSAARFAGARAVQVLGYVVGTAVVGGAIAALLFTDELRLAVLVGLQVFAVFGTPYWWGLAVRREAEATALAEQRADDERRFAEISRAEVVRSERARMAGDLHDALSGNLSAIAIHAEAALSTDDPETDREALRSIRESSVLALSELQSMVVLLRADGAQRERSSTARLAELGDLVAEARRRGLSVAWTGADLGPLSAVVDQAAYRIVQESLTNAAKHAPGSVVDLSVSRDGTDVVVEVQNDAGQTPTSTAEGVGVGLSSMRERAEALGGRFDAGWQIGGPARRWTVRAELPTKIEEV